MPLLSEDEIYRLLLGTLFPFPCSKCSGFVKDYCRTCDAFYFIHQAGCSHDDLEHWGHRTCLIPYVEANVYK